MKIGLIYAPDCQDEEKLETCSCGNLATRDANTYCSDFINTLNKNDGNLIHEELKSYLAEFLEFEQDSYGLNVGIDIINDPMEYGELVKVTAVIVIP